MNTGMTFSGCVFKWFSRIVVGMNAIINTIAMSENTLDTPKNKAFATVLFFFSTHLEFKAGKIIATINRLKNRSIILKFSWFVISTYNNIFNKQIIIQTPLVV